VSEIEFYEGKPIFYGLGNFVFDQTHTDPTRQGIFLKIIFYKKNLVSVTIIPHQSCGPQQSAVDSEECNHFQPQIIEENDPVYQVILDRVWEYSDI
jgi:poly-gamma-glutamate capsule biosynthesis protein CapA/YwtB (metallophosphatase superfamily)